MHIASAYGVARPRAVQSPTQPPSIPISRGQSTPAVQSVERIGAELGVNRPESVNRLVGGTVDAPIRFDGAAIAVPEAGGALPLYTRAADKIEATVAVSVGRAIDITG